MQARLLEIPQIIKNKIKIKKQAVVQGSANLSYVVLVVWLSHDRYQTSVAKASSIPPSGQQIRSGLSVKVSWGNIYFYFLLMLETCEGDSLSYIYVEG